MHSVEFPYQILSDEEVRRHFSSLLSKKQISLFSLHIWYEKYMKIFSSIFHFQLIFIFNSILFKWRFPATQF